MEGGEPETSQGIKPPVKTVDAKSLGQSQGQEHCPVSNSLINPLGKHAG